MLVESAIATVRVADSAHSVRHFAAVVALGRQGRLEHYVIFVRRAPGA